MIISFILVVFAAIAQAAPAGKVTNLDGRADVTVANKPAKGLIIGDAVNVGDIIRTKSASKCEVTFIDGSIIRLAANSRLKVTEYNLRKESRTTILSLFRGKVQNVVTATSKLFGEKGGSKYEVHTPTAVCGVRGTTFFSYHQNGVSGALFTEGQGYVYSKGQPGVVKPIAPGQMMIITSANKLPESKPATSDDANKFFKETTLSEKKKDTQKDGDDKGTGGGGTSGSGGSSSSGSSGSSSSSGSGDSTNGGTDGSGGTTCGTMLDGTTGSTTLGGTTTGTLLAGTSTPTPTPTVIIPPVQQDKPEPVPPAPPEPVPPDPVPPAPPDPIPPDPVPPETSTTFNQPVNLGSISGTLTGSISDTTNTGTLSLTGTGTATTSSTALSGTLSDGSTYTGSLVGIPGSWNGLMSAIYKNNSGGIGLLSADLTGAIIGNNLTASGNISRSSILGTFSEVYSPEIGFKLPIFDYDAITVGGTTNAYYITSGPNPDSGTVNAYKTTTGSVVGTWSVANTAYTFINNTAVYAWTNAAYGYGEAGSYYVLGNISGGDTVEAGYHHLRLAGSLDYIDSMYAGTVTLNYRGTYETDYDGGTNGIIAGVGTYELVPLTFRGNIESGTFKVGSLGEGYTDDGSLEGIIGSTNSFISGQAPLRGIGFYSASADASRFETVLSGSVTASANSMMRLWFGGARTGNSLNGRMIGLYVENMSTENIDDPIVLNSGTEAVEGALYPDIYNMWKITSGSLKSYDSTGFESPHLGNISSNGSEGYELPYIMNGSFVSFHYMPYNMLDPETGPWNHIWMADIQASGAGMVGVGSTAVAGFAESNYYSLSHIEVTGWDNDGGPMSASVISGRTLDLYKTGRITGDILGVSKYTAGDPGSSAWRGLGMGQIENQTLEFSSNLIGNLYQVVAGTVYSREYQRPNWNVSSSYWFAPLRYETSYFVPTVGTYDVTKTIAFESADRKISSYIYSDDYQYFPDGTWAKISKGPGITYMAGAGTTSELSPVPDFTTTPLTSPNFDGTIVENPLTPFISNNNYVLASTSLWSTNALLQNGAFTGILGGLNTVSLWNSDDNFSSGRTNIILMGSHNAYNGSQIFDTTMFYNGSGTSNGAFFGKLTGIIQDNNAYSENPLEGMIIGLYIDPAGNAGVLKGDFTGTSYKGIGMWESSIDEDATLYRYSYPDIGEFGGSFQELTASGLSTPDFSGGNAIFNGIIGAGINSTFNGTFDGEGKIYSPLGIMGSTFSIVSQPDWGIFTMKIGLANTYENPTSATSWTSTLFSSGMFGLYTADYGQYADLGYWHAGIDDGTWSDDGKLTGTLSGQFITHKKIGTLEGLLLGTYSILGTHESGAEYGTWEATAAGTYVKTQDVSFSSDIWGKSYAMASGNSGNSSSPGVYSYNYWYSNTAGNSNNYGNSTYTTIANGTLSTRTITRFNISGPPDAPTYQKNVWVQSTGVDGNLDSSDDKYTFSQTVYSTVAAYNTAMSDLETDPNTGSPIGSTDQLSYHYSNFNGILAGVVDEESHDLWTNITNYMNSVEANEPEAQPTPVSLMGDINAFHNNNSRKLFTGTIVSFNPLVTLNPYVNSAAPIGGAYHAYLGGAFGGTVTEDKTLDGMMSGLYLDPDGKAGVLYGTITGNNPLNSGYWTGEGTISGYQLLASATGCLTPANFASNLTIFSSYDPSSVTSDPDFTGVGQPNTPFEGLSLPGTPSTRAYSIVESTFLDSEYGGFFGVYSFVAGGTYGGTVTNESYLSTVESTFSATYSSTYWDGPPVDATTIRSGSVLQGGYFDPETATGFLSAKTDYMEGKTIISGGDIKGLFDPAKSTWQAVSNGISIETAAFVNLVNSLSTDAERNAFMSAMKIPCINVGQMDLSGTRGQGTDTMSVTMTGVTFYAYSTGQTPKLFATNNVTGSYNVSGLAGVAIPAPVTLNATNMSNLANVTATFTPTTAAGSWTSGKWGAQVAGAATMTTPSTGIVFKGGATGTTSGGAIGTITSGTAAGIVGKVTLP